LGASVLIRGSWYDCRLQSDEGMEHASLKSALGQFGEEALDGIDP
jgi:hypothetical protein